MMRPSVIVVTIGMLAACGGFAYLYAKHEQTAVDTAGSSKPTDSFSTTHSTAPAPAVPVSAAANANTAAPTSPNPDKSASTATPATSETIDQQIKDTESTDAKTRAAAIAALADAPKAQAMPALERVLDNGEPNVDRHVALHSMYSLALRDGDPNGQIRDVMRRAIYHGDDDGVTQTAQSLLDDIEAEFALREQNQRH